VNYDKLLSLHHIRTKEELLADIGNRVIEPGDEDKNVLKGKQGTNWKKYLTFSFGNKDAKSTKEETRENDPSKEKINLKKVLRITEDAIQKNYIIADCCSPIPGDDVLGYLDEHEKVIIHKRQCPVAVKLKSSYGNRIIAAKWDTHKPSLSFLVDLNLSGIDSVGLLNDITQVISRQLNVNIRKLSVETNDGIFTGKMQLYVHDVDDVKRLTAKLLKIPNVKTVTRG
jgi:GTP pyrophosphokinase